MLARTSYTLTTQPKNTMPGRCLPQNPCTPVPGFSGPWVPFVSLGQTYLWEEIMARVTPILENPAQEH